MFNTLLKHNKNKTECKRQNNQKFLYFKGNSAILTYEQEKVNNIEI